MKEFILRSEQTIDRPIDEVFEFFSDPHNLGEITPPFLGFRVLSCSTPAICKGSLIDYKIRLRGLPLRWRSLISAFEPPFRFVDEQVRGPYRRWVHEHTFEDRNGKTLVRDEVRYAVLGGALINRLLVRKDLQVIFDYRSRRLTELLGP